MDHIMFIQKTKEDKREQYIKAHVNVWPDCLKAHRDAGIERELIWIEGNNLYVYMMGNNLKRALDTLKNIQVFKDWIEEMAPLMDQRQDFSPNGEIKHLVKVFDLEEQLKNLD